MTTTATFITSGMHCSSCSMLVTMNLEDLGGVQEVSCDHATGKTVVTYDAERVTPDMIRKAIEAAGYDAELAS